MTAARSGENTTYDARATWNTPSVNWLAKRTANRSRKPLLPQQVDEIPRGAHGPLPMQSTGHPTFR